MLKQLETAPFVVNLGRSEGGKIGPIAKVNLIIIGLLGVTMSFAMAATTMINFTVAAYQLLRIGTKGINHETIRTIPAA